MWHLYKLGEVAKTRKYSCELNCTSNGFCFNFLYLAINHSHRGSFVCYLWWTYSCRLCRYWHDQYASGLFQCLLLISWALSHKKILTSELKLHQQLKLLEVETCIRGLLCVENVGSWRIDSHLMHNCFVLSSSLQRVKYLGSWCFLLLKFSSILGWLVSTILLKNKGTLQRLLKRTILEFCSTKEKEKIWGQISAFGAFLMIL